MRLASILKRTSLIAMAAHLLVPSMTAHAQSDTYPSRPIQIVVPYAAGGITDQSSRIISEALARALKQPVVIENRPGGGGRIGANAVARMEPDGYRLLLTTNGTHTYMAVTEESLPYDPLEDFTPISLLASYGFLMVANPAVPANNVKELIDYAKKNPGKLSYASSGPGGGPHFAGEVFKYMADIDMLHVPYKGTGPGLLAVAAGHTDIVFAGEAKPFIDSEKVKFLGTTSASRDPRYPEKPTIGESGLEGYDLTSWIGLYGPRVLPEEIQKKLSEAVSYAMQDPAVRERLSTLGLVPVGNSPEELVDHIKAETAKLRTVADNVPSLVQK